MTPKESRDKYRSGRCMLFWMLVLCCVGAILLFGHPAEATPTGLTRPQKSRSGAPTERVVLATTKGVCATWDLCGEDGTLPELTCWTHAWNSMRPSLIRCEFALGAGDEPAQLHMHKYTRSRGIYTLSTEDDEAYYGWILTLDLTDSAAGDISSTDLLLRLVRLVGFQWSYAVMVVVITDKVTGKTVQSKFAWAQK